MTSRFFGSSMRSLYWKPHHAAALLPNALPAYAGFALGRGRHVDDADLEDVARLGVAHRYGSRADVHAQARRPRRPCDPSDRRRADPRFLLAVPVENALGPRIALDHPLEVVVRVMRQRLDGDEIPRVDFDKRLQLSG